MCSLPHHRFGAYIVFLCVLPFLDMILYCNFKNTKMANIKLDYEQFLPTSLYLLNSPFKKNVESNDALNFVIFDEQYYWQLYLTVLQPGN